MTGLVLEGGGARGAYHIGAVKAYMEKGYTFDGVFGTSIGSFNAAMIAQGDFHIAEEFWKSITMSQVFDVEEGLGLVGYAHLLVKDVIKAKGIDTSNLRKRIEESVDEQRLRDSNVEYGLVTISLDSKKGVELYKEDIPPGKLHSYIMASSCFPGFKTEVIDGERFLDGGPYNNLPVNMALKKGCTEIIAVRTTSQRRKKKIKKAGAVVTYITPKEPLGNMLIVSHDKTNYLINLGYYDALKQIYGLKGFRYYIKPEPSGDSYFMKLLTDISGEALEKTAYILGIKKMPPKRALFEEIIPKLAKHYKLAKRYDYADFVLALVESIAEKQGAERFRIISFERLLGEIDAEKLDASGSHLKLGQLDIAANPVTKFEDAAEIIVKELRACVQ